MNLLYDRDGEFVLVTFDATVTERHERTAEITTHPVEQFTDHIRVQPIRLNADVHVSNNPVRSPDVDEAFGDVRGLKLTRNSRGLTKGVQINQKNDVDEAQYEDLTESVAANTLQFAEPFNRVRAVESQLNELLVAGTKLTIVTELRTYENMVLQSIVIPRDANNANAATITLDLVEVRIANTSIVDAPRPREIRAEPSDDQSAGTQSPVEEDRASIAYRVVQAGAQRFGFDLL